MYYYEIYLKICPTILWYLRAKIRQETNFIIVVGCLRWPSWNARILNKVYVWVLDDVERRGNFFNSSDENKAKSDTKSPRKWRIPELNRKYRKWRITSDYRTEMRSQRIADQMLKNNSECKDLRDGLEENGQSDLLDKARLEGICSAINDHVNFMDFKWWSMLKNPVDFNWILDFKQWPCNAYLKMIATTTSILFELRITRPFDWMKNSYWLQ